MPAAEQKSISYSKLQSIFTPSFLSADAADQQQKTTFRFHASDSQAVEPKQNTLSLEKESNSQKDNGAASLARAVDIAPSLIVLKPRQSSRKLGMMFYRHESTEQVQDGWLKSRQQLTRDFKNKSKQAAKRKRSSVQSQNKKRRVSKSHG